MTCEYCGTRAEALSVAERVLYSTIRLVLQLLVIATIVVSRAIRILSAWLQGSKTSYDVPALVFICLQTLACCNLPVDEIPEQKL